MSNNEKSSSDSISIRTQDDTKRVAALRTVATSQDAEVGRESLQKLYDCSSSEANSIWEIIRMGKMNQKNTTLDMLIINIIRSLRSNDPLELQMSQCIDKKPDVRMNKFDMFCNPAESRPSNINLPNGAVQGMEEKGWQEARRLQNLTNAKITILIGDQDFFTLDRMNEWASNDTLLKLQEEVSALRISTEERVKDFFGNTGNVDQWSSFYGQNEFQNELLKAEESKSKWLTGKFLRTSQRPYMRSWGYPEIAEKKGVSEATLMNFIESDIVRTAAQYRVESRIIMNRNAIQCWAETCGDPIWPMTISNYDNAGSPPSISLL